MTLFLKQMRGEWAVMDATSDTVVATFKKREQAKIYIRCMVGAEHHGYGWIAAHTLAVAIATVDERSVELDDGSWKTKELQVKKTVDNLQKANKKQKKGE